MVLAVVVAIPLQVSGFKVVVVEVLEVLALMQPLMDWELPVEMEEHFLHFLHL